MGLHASKAKEAVQADIQQTATVNVTHIEHYGLTLAAGLTVLAMALLIALIIYCLKSKIRRQVQREIQRSRDNIPA